MVKPELMWKDSRWLSSGNCCPALYRANGDYIVQGIQVDPKKVALHDLASDEAAVFVPQEMMQRFILDEMADRQRGERVKAPYMQPWAEDLLRMVGPSVGDSIVDYACGTGFTARAALAAVGDGGRIVAVDTDPLSLVHVGQSSTIETHLASESGTTLADASCDLVLCQQGMQYMSDPKSVAKEIFRLVKAGGTVAISIWDDLRENDFLAAQADVIEDLVSRRAALGARRITVANVGGRPGLAAILESAGFVDVRLETRQLEVPLPPNYVRSLVEEAPPSSVFSALKRPEREMAVERIAAAVDRSSGREYIKMSSVVATGVAPM